MKCGFCESNNLHIFVDLGIMPPANAYVKANEAETYFPLRVYVCDACKLVQVQKFETPENIFLDYAYFSSISRGWQKHCREYSEMIISNCNIDKNSFVVEIASNDGCLLKNFIAKGIPVVGVEPAKNVAASAIKNGVPTFCDFFNTENAKKIINEHRQPDLIIANNVFAHTPDINDFAEGIRELLIPGGIVTFEFPGLRNLINEGQFDTIYHEHFYYYSLTIVQKILIKHGLRVFHVENLPTHGGSLRVYACHEHDQTHTINSSVENELEKEKNAGLNDLNVYLGFDKRVQQIKKNTLNYLLKCKEEGNRIVAFGAAAKGSTFLNYCGIKTDIVDYVIDETPYKQGLNMPGVQIPIYPLEKLAQDKPDIIIILPWNWKDEIAKKINFIGKNGGKAVTFIPDLQEHVFDGTML